MYFADPNFGIFPDHVDIAARIAELKQGTGYPAIVYATTAKNVSDRIVEIARTLGDVSMPVWMSVQSLTEDVLKNIKRRNIKVSAMIDIQHKLSEANASSKSDLILGLPGETLATHLASSAQLMEYGMDHVNSFQLMMVNGSEMKSDLLAKADPNLVTKFRVSTAE